MALMSSTLSFMSEPLLWILPESINFFLNHQVRFCQFYLSYTFGPKRVIFLRKLFKGLILKKTFGCFEKPLDFTWPSLKFNGHHYVSLWPSSQQTQKGGLFCWSCKTVVVLKSRQRPLVFPLRYHNRDGGNVPNLPFLHKLMYVNEILIREAKK